MSVTARSTTDSIKSLSLGNALVALGLLPQKRLADALEEQKRTGRKLGEILLQNGYVVEEDIAKVLAAQQGLAFIDLRRYDLQLQLVRLLTEVQSRKFKAIVLDDLGDAYRVGVVDPSNLSAQDELAGVLGKPLELMVVSPDHFSATVERVYGNSGQLTEFAREVESDVDRGANVINLNIVSTTVDDQDAPVVKLLQSIFKEAVQSRASDVHIEPQAKRLLVRFRIDGMLRTQFESDQKIGPPLVVRLKIMAGLDIAEKRLPQDGRLSVQQDERRLDVRLSTLTTEFGESVVLRILAQSQGARDISTAGLPPDMLDRFLKAISAPHGIILATGPTGSGKTTTLYGALARLNRPEVKILTAEDPIEYRIGGINQVQVNDKIGLTFPKILRAFLRQDPDIMLVGEIRDGETAEIAVRAAMTGHLVLSTVHTNDAASTPTRLLDMGVPGYLMATTLRAVVAQRLLRRVCTHCVESYEPSFDERVWMEHFFAQIPSTATFAKGRGCGECNGSGYLGRIGAFEMLEMSPALAEALHRGEPTEFERIARDQIGEGTLSHNGLRLVFAGTTTISEVMRITVAVD